VRPGDDYQNCTTLDDVVKHICHIGDKIGYDYVGIGGDFNGAGSFPIDAKDVSSYPKIMAKLGFNIYCVIFIGCS